MEREDAGTLFSCKGAVPVQLGREEDLAESTLDCPVGALLRNVDCCNRKIVQPYVVFPIHTAADFSSQIAFLGAVQDLSLRST